MASVRGQCPSAGRSNQANRAGPGPRPAAPTKGCLIIHPLPVVRLGVATLLREIGVEVIDEGSTMAEASAWLASHDVGLVLVGPELPDGWGLDLIGSAARRRQRPAWVVVATSGGGPLVAEALRRGASGFITLSSELAEVRAIVATVMRGEAAFTGAQLASARAAADRHLRPRERIVVRLLARGLSNAAIGAALGVSRRTIETYLARLYDRFGVSCRIELVNRLRADGLLEAVEPSSARSVERPS